MMNSPEYLLGYLQGVMRSDAIKCSKGKPCGEKCIPKNYECRDGKSGQKKGRNLGRTAAIGGAIAAGVAGASIAGRREGQKNIEAAKKQKAENRQEAKNRAAAKEGNRREAAAKQRSFEKKAGEVESQLSALEKRSQETDDDRERREIGEQASQALNEIMGSKLGSDKSKKNKLQRIRRKKR
jgi:hypothetical protein